MARIARTKLENITQRDALEVRVEPHYVTIEPGRLLGLIAKGKGESGTWVARAKVEGLNKRKVLGYSCVQSKEADADGVSRLSFNQARAAALDWNPVMEAAVKNVCTLNDAIEAHKGYTGKKSKKLPENMQAAYDALRYKVLGLGRKGKLRKECVVLVPGQKASALEEGQVYALDGRTPVNALTTEMLTALRGSWIVPGVKASLATALRNWTNLHSCLEQAYLKQSNGIPSPAAWQKVDKMEQTHNGRILHFTDEQSVAILSLIRRDDAQVADYLEGIYRAGTRPGDELMTLRARDFNGKTLSITKSKTGPRTVSLSPLALAFFQRVAAGRAPNAPMFSPDGERHWDVVGDRLRIKTALVAAVREVLGAAAFEGDGAYTDDDIVPYAFRHTFISRRIANGMKSRAIAKVCGTSEYMIDKNYAKEFAGEEEAALAASDPKVTLRIAA